MWPKLIKIDKTAGLKINLTLSDSCKKEKTPEQSEVLSGRSEINSVGCVYKN
ncbi:hypothetical protein [Pedobacter punctiformis]|uniref:Uncharacterized protein n=1 Tax=Pedobacter punctiformis TaxID=3004097 RepID=A0ABT4L3N3_9SPHI|nr:hypothetical protein [Pedobacter sp. HCMS5-2]MCZ4242520.1 hypothetical protein [Pedobacter sp. HCMS5-2]